jgi:hypothetical protein
MTDLLQAGRPRCDLRVVGEANPTAVAGGSRVRGGIPGQGADVNRLRNAATTAGSGRRAAGTLW